MNLSHQRSFPMLITIIVCVCIISCLGILAFNAAFPATGMKGHVCIGFITTPKWQLGLSWALPISSYMPSLALSPYTFCTDVPDTWLTPFTSQMAGEWLFPP